MKEQMLILAEMQAYDDQIGSKLELKKVLPKQLETLFTDVEEAKVKVTEVHAEVDELLLAQKSNEGVIQANKELIAKYAVQLNAIKTNKEYKALNKEIEALQKKNSGAETKIINLMDATNTKRAEQKAAKIAQKGAENNLKAQEAELTKMIAALDVDIQLLKDKRNELTKGLPMTMTRKYILLLKNKKRKAVVFNVKGACSGCGYQVRPQVMLELEDRDKLHYCENCSRIIMNKPPKVKK